MKLLLPAARSYYSQQPETCSKTPKFFGGTHRGCLNILYILYLHLKPHFPLTGFDEMISADFFSLLTYVVSAPATSIVPSIPKPATAPEPEFSLPATFPLMPGLSFSKLLKQLVLPSFIATLP
jgi:hypothetical protein